MIAQFAFHGEVSDSVTKLVVPFPATTVSVFNDGAADLAVCFTGEDPVVCSTCRAIGHNGFIVLSRQTREFNLAPGTRVICVCSTDARKTAARVEAYHY